MHPPEFINIFRWLTLPCSYFALYLRNEKIPTIWVESPSLTASYYKEYLDFCEIKRVVRSQKMEILLKKRNNWIWIKSIDEQEIGNSNTVQRLAIKSSSIESEFSILSEKVRVATKFNSKTSNGFSVEDCNGIEIVFTSGRTTLESRGKVKKL